VQLLCSVICFLYVRRRKQQEGEEKKEKKRRKNGNFFKHGNFWKKLKIIYEVGQKLFL
jgi:hypothetical protein